MNGADVLDTDRVDAEEVDGVNALDTDRVDTKKRVEQIHQIYAK